MQTGALKQNKEMNQLIGFFILEILVGVNAGVTFAMVESRYTAALWTGACFAVLGFVLIYWSFYHSRKIMLAVALIHTLVFSLPIWLTRAMTQNDLPLDTVMGVPGPLVHKAASGVYWLLVAVTVVELAKIIKASFARLN